MRALFNNDVSIKRLQLPDGRIAEVITEKGKAPRVQYYTESGMPIYVPIGETAPTTIEGWNRLAERQREQQKIDFEGYFGRPPTEDEVWR
jgi:hypothetical protein